jgi:hypothetical protein
LCGTFERVKARTTVYLSRTLGSLTYAYKVVKGKAIPLQASIGPEGSRRLRLPDFKTVGT